MDCTKSYERFTKELGRESSKFYLKDSSGQVFETNTLDDDSKWLHREDGGPAVILKNKFWWYSNGKLDREGGPAIVDTEKGTEFWFQNDKRHRLNGPAVSQTNSGHCEYWVLNKQIAGDIFNSIVSSTSKSELVSYLVDPNEGLRFLANHKLKEIS